MNVLWDTSPADIKQDRAENYFNNTTEKGAWVWRINHVAYFFPIKQCSLFYNNTDLVIKLCWAYDNFIYAEIPMKQQNMTSGFCKYILLRI